VVLEGVVLDVQGNNPETATIKVSRYFKGSGRETIEISGFMGVYCRPNVTRGEHAIFFANGDSGSNLKSYTDYGTASRTEPTPTNIAEVISTTGQQPTLPTDVTPTATPIIATPTIPAPIPTPTPTVTTQTETGNNMWLWVGLGAVVVIGGGAFLLTKRRR
jgi:LPXTG-motif cell wall-anchored protein